MKKTFLAVALLLAGCIAPPKTPLLEVAPVFGSTRVGQKTTAVAILANTNPVPVSVLAVTSSNPSFVVSFTQSESIPAGGTLMVMVTFQPTKATKETGNLTFETSAGNVEAVVYGTAIDTFVVLTWNASTTADVVGYNVYRSTTSGSGYVIQNTGLVVPVPAMRTTVHRDVVVAVSGLTWLDYDVDNGVTYYYVTTAVDSSGNESAYSNEASASIQ